MRPSKFMLGAAVCSSVSAHIRMKFPPPRGDPNLSYTGAPDYNLSSPLSSATMCGGKRPGQISATFRASYSWPVKLPANLPSCEKCTFAWTWINAVGNREYYMNCADVKIIGTQQGNIAGKSLYVANLPGYPVNTPSAYYGGPWDSKFKYYDITATLTMERPGLRAPVHFIRKDEMKHTESAYVCSIRIRAFAMNFVALIIILVVFNSDSFRDFMSQKIGAAYSRALFCLANVVSMLFIVNLSGISFQVLRSIYNMRHPCDTNRSSTASSNLLKTSLVLQPRNIVRESESLEGRNGIKSANLQSTQTPYRNNKFSSVSSEGNSLRPECPSSTMKEIYGGLQKEENLQNRRRDETLSLINDIPSSRLPDTGSPMINRVACKNLPNWTESLRQALISKDQKEQQVWDTAVGTASVPEPFFDKASNKIKTKKVISPDNSLKQLGLLHKIDAVTENLCVWFSVKIIRPLSSSILEISREFSASGLDHLSPQIPASFSMFSKNISGYAGSTENNSYILSPPGFAASAVPQTLLELFHKYPNNELVLKRLHVERYLSFAAIASQRSAVIKRIHEMSADGLFKSLSLMASSLTFYTADSNSCEEDAILLMHLFCSFMDEKLPSEQYMNSQPFSTKHFVSTEEKTSERSDAIQIHQAQRHPPRFRVIAEDKIYEVDSGCRAVFQAIIILVEYLHQNHSGYLGVGNLASPAISLTSILDTDNI